MPNQPYTPLLQVFYFGLVHGIVSKQDITAWADSIIMAEDEPEHFIIELSTAGDINELFKVINSVVDTALTPLSARAVLGLIRHRLDAGAIDIEKAISLCSALPSRDVLTWSETSEIYDIEGDFYPTEHIEDEYREARQESAIQFLNFYAPFKLNNYQEWEEINIRLTRTLADEEADHQKQMEHWRTGQPQAIVTSQRKTKTYRLISYGLGAITFFISAQGYSRLDSDQPMSQLFWDIWAFSMLYFMFFACYHVVLAARSVLRKLFSKYF